MALNKMVLGRSTEATAPDALRAVFAEFIATFLFVFIGVGSCIAHSKLSDGPLEAAGLVCIAIAHGLAIAVTVAATANISGGHVNPAVTFGLAVGGYITIVRAAFYWIAQLLGATLAAYLLKAIILTTGLSMPIHGLGAGVSITGGLILETVLTFALVFVIYATAVDGKRGQIGIIAPLAIGFTVLADHFIGVPFTGASMNPARSFGPAFAAMDFHNHWIYWVGPLLGGGIAGIIYDGVFMTAESDILPLPTDADV
ncbi:aquaporin TIP [Marchantia polymorpha subsp. ruderalis]|uniref:Uncharacterized protein n=3 Tax=Marchantia polymorpha TaxID=3197 RepID=A0AAF6BR04_MARPO|nr:hypothetical protein MARPO_0223s0007 [Marchantia polymorpha]BBN14438.1 hypothetical protein Mp_6g11720 [Marchantia polymorpha subsp. ruderalis]|eukprot:PTQ27105.1 hypothetical protein MARPO_0223s0007 [Marchantia polymorpha]